MLSLGQRFREQREKQKISLDAISARTKISPRYLQAIETENFDDLPAGLFRRSFIRQYATALNLDESNLDSELDELLGRTDSGRAATRLPDPDPFTEELIQVEPVGEVSSEPRGEHRMAWSIGLLIFTVAACSGIYALWQHTQEGGPIQQSIALRQAAIESRPAPAPSDQVTPAEEAAPPPQPAGTQEQRAEPLALSEPAASRVEEAPPVVAQAAAADAQQELSEAARLKTAAVEPTPEEPQPVAEAAETPAAPIPTSAPAPSKIIVEVAASDRVWVRMTADRQTVFRGMLQPSERKSIEGTGRTRVLVGDAAAVNVIWNGKSIGPIGRSGQMRVIEFTPDTFQILSP